MTDRETEGCEFCSTAALLVAERLRSATLQESIDGCAKRVAQLSAALRAVQDWRAAANLAPDQDAALKALATIQRR